MKHDNPFAKLGALDQKLYRETSPQLRDDHNQNSGNQENQNTRNLEINNSSNIEYQNSGIPENKSSRKQGSQNTSKREFFTKATYRLCDEALDAIGDAKNVLRRQYKLKVNLEEIVETAVLKAYKDLVDNKEKSILVSKYSGNQENQKS